MTNGNSAALSQRQALEFIDAELTQYLEHMPMDETSRNLRDVARAALSVCADGGKGEAVAEMNVTHDGRGNTRVTWKTLKWDMPDGLYNLYAAPQAECAPRAKDRLWLMIADNFTREEFEQAFAECAPRAKKSYGSGMIDAIEDFAPVPAPRADADTAGAFPVSKEIIEAIQSYGDLRADRASNTADKIGEVILMIRDALATAGASNERADAEKDAALTDEQIVQLFYAAQGDITQFRIKARAILAANKGQVNG